MVEAVSFVPVPARTGTRPCVDAVPRGGRGCEQVVDDDVEWVDPAWSRSDHQPVRGGERAGRISGSVSSGEPELDSLGLRIEPDEMHSGRRAGADDRDVGLARR